MKKHLVIILTILIVASLLSLSYAQTEQKDRKWQGRMGQMGPSEVGFAALSPDSKFVYVVGKDTIYQYTAIDLKLTKSTYIGSSDVKMPLAGGSIFFSRDSKFLYVMRGKTLLLFEALELKYIKKATIE